MADPEDDRKCPGCGSSLASRKTFAAPYPTENIPLGLWACRHCGAQKCCMCDMGNDVECISCPDED